jgi:molecular chaperone GrpE
MPEKAKKIKETANQKEEQADLAAENAPTEQEKNLQDVDYKAIIDDLNDKVLRAMAEAQNTRRRADIDIQSARNFGIQSFAKDLLGVLDNLFRASDTICDADSAADPKLKAVKEGIEITKREMINVFERSGIRRIEPANEAFDPNLHQAISQVTDANVAAGTVLQVLQSGYILKDRLLRPALVVVSKATD